MSLHVAEVLRTGVDRTTANTGLQFVGIFFVLNAINALFVTAAAQQATMGRPSSAGPSTAPLPGVSPVIGGLVSFGVAIASVVVLIAAIRTFVSPETESIPREHFTHRLAWTWFNFVIGAIVFSIVVVIGLILLIVPGLFLLVALFFWSVFVAEEGETFIDALQSSWHLTKGYRVRLFLLGIVVVVTGVVIGGIFNLPSVLFPGFIGIISQALGSAIVSVFYVATLTAAYIQLSTPDETDETVGIQHENNDSTGFEYGGAP